MPKVLLVLFFSSFALAEADYKEMPLLNHKQMQEKMDLVLYSASHHYEEIEVKKDSEDGASFSHVKAKLHYNEYLNGLGGALDLEIYTPEVEGGEKLPVVVIFPPIGGISIIDHSYARYFARKGYIAVISQLTENILSLSSVTEVMDSFKNTMIRNRILVDYLETHPSVDNSKIGVFGISLGGIRSALFYGIEKRVNSAVSIAGGGNMPGTMAYSEQPTVVQLKTRLMKRHELEDDEAYEDYLRENYSVDATNFSLQVDPKDFYLVIGKKDVDVPTRYQRELEKRYSHPKVKALPFDHTWTILYMFLFKRSVGKFFDNNYALVNAVQIDEEKEEQKNREMLDEVLQEIEEKY